LIAASADSLLMVSLNADGMHLTCVRGPIIFRSAEGRQTSLGAGRCCEWASGHLTEPASAVAFASKAECRDDAAECVELEMMMKRLSSAEWSSSRAGLETD
jgi:hypothetical protein